MQERQLALNISRLFAQDIVDENGGITLGGHFLSLKYAERLYKAGGYNPMDIHENSQALRHWVASVGYGSDGRFKIILSDTIQI